MGVVVDIAPNLDMVLLTCGREEGYNDVGAGDKSNNCNDAEIIIMGIPRTCRADDQRVGEGDNDVIACDSYGHTNSNYNYYEL